MLPPQANIGGVAGYCIIHGGLDLATGHSRHTVTKIEMTQAIPHDFTALLKTRWGSPHVSLLMPTSVV